MAKQPSFTTRLAESAVQRWAGMDAFPEPPLIRTHYPVVFMHGFGAIASFRRGGHLHDEAMNLRLHGVWAYAPNVAPYACIADRAAMWRDRLAHVLEETGAAKVNIVAHSMGGLDARYLISRLGMHTRIVSLTTVSTPHQGSPVASFLLERPERVLELMADFVNWFGISAMKEGTADVIQALHELAPEHVRHTFNPDVPDHPDVRYFSYAGRAGKGTDIPINPLLRPLNAIVYNQEGVNDGYVSVESAQWGEFLGPLDADHTQQIGLPTLPGSSAAFDSNAFFVSVAERLAAEGL